MKCILSRQRTSVVALFFLVCVSLLAPPHLGADAIVKTQAMLATTICEIWIEEGGISIELEIGGRDLEAFADLLPDPLFERLGSEVEPLTDRFPRFVTEGFVISLSDGRPLPARVAEMETRIRVRRDEISGDPLPAEEGVEPERVLFVRFEYPIPGPVKQLVFGGTVPGRSASIGFVVYHEGIAVNDFRYLGQRQVLNLDWNDPWYTTFENRNLRRTYFAPMNGFIYVEHYEVRKEIILRPIDLQRWVDLGLEGRETIPVEMQVELKQRILDFLDTRQPLAIDGEPRSPDFTRIDFLERTLKSSRVIDPPEELDVHSALLGVIYIFVTDGLPQKVTMNWDLFDDRIQKIPASAVDQAGPLPSFLDPDFPVLEWTNFLKNPVVPTLAEISPPPSLMRRVFAFLGWPASAVSITLIAWAVVLFLRSDPRRTFVAALGAVSVFLAATGFFWGTGPRPSAEAASEVVGGLLHNVYRAFDFRQEARIYDTLERSIEGDLLTDIYLQTRRGLELANQGGAQAKVKDIELEGLEVNPGKDGGFSADATWVVRASVGHWGHVHQRQNRYRAALDIRPVGGVWKLFAVEIMEEERL